MPIEIRNARIRKTMLGYEDHGMLSFTLDLEYGGAGQGAGMYQLDSYDKEKKERVDTHLVGFMLRRVLKTVGVEKWEDLPGKYIRVKQTHTKVHAIGNVLKDDWFEFDEFEKEIPDAH